MTTPFTPSTPSSAHASPTGPADYRCRRVASPLTIDGDLGKPVWQQALKSRSFVDMVNGSPAFYDTRIAALWDERNFYVAFWVQEPQVAASLTQRDSLIFQENDVELFIDGGDCYYEFEINALNTVYEVFFIWRDAYIPGSRFDVPEFDVHRRNALTFAGDYDRNPKSFWRGTHPRGVRWAFLDWDMAGLQTAVRVDGTINDPGTIDRGWTVEMSIPWASMKHLAGGRSLPPSEGDVWRMFFGRFQKLMALGQEIQPHPAWCLNPHGVMDTHQPEKWSRVQFTRALQS